MRIIKANSKNLQETIKAIKEGKVLVCPTDTVYGLICDAKNKKSVTKIFRIKKRPKGKPISIFVKNLGMAKKFAKIDKKTEGFLKEAWPGAITAVLRPKKNLPCNISKGKNTIGLRIPKYKMITILIDKINRPLAESSANISGQPPSGSIKKVLRQFKRRKYQPDLIIDAGNLPKSKPSTVLDLTIFPPKVLRH